MLTISKWASRNKWTARMLIVILHLLLLSCGILLGISLFAKSLFLPNGLVEVCCGVLLLAFIFYPKKGEDKLAFYYQRLRFDSVIYGLAFLLSAFFGNQLLLPETTTPVSTPQPKATFIVYKTAPHTTPTPDVRTQLPKKRINRFFAKRLKKMARKVERKMQKRNDDVGLKILAILITIILMIFLGGGLLALSCSLSCSGYSTAATLVVVLGIPGLIAGLVAIFRAILGIKKKKPEDMDIP